MAIFFASKATDETNRRRVYAQNAEAAAVLFVEVSEQEAVSFPVGSGSEETEVIVKTEKGELFRFAVSGEPRPVYRAKNIVTSRK